MLEPHVDYRLMDHFTICRGRQLAHLYCYTSEKLKVKSRVDAFLNYKDVLIADCNKWSNDPSMYNPHEAPTLLSLMLLKEISE